MTVRFRTPAAVGRPLRIEVRVESSRPKLLRTTGDVRDAAGALVASASGKYVPLPPGRNREFLATLVDEPATLEAARVLWEAAAVTA